MVIFTVLNLSELRLTLKAQCLVVFIEVSDAPLTVVLANFVTVEV